MKSILPPFFEAIKHVCHSFALLANFDLPPGRPVSQPVTVRVMVGGNLCQPKGAGQWLLAPAGQAEA